MRQPKTGSTTVSEMLGICGHAARGGDRATCMEPDALAEMEPAAIKHIWSEYVVFTVTRNPFSRALSSWAYLHSPEVGPGRP